MVIAVPEPAPPPAAAWPWPLDAVQSWFEALWNTILDWVERAARAVTTALSAALTAAQAALTAILTPIGSAVTGLYAWVSDQAINASAWLWGQVQGPLDTVSRLLVDVASRVGGVVVDIGAGVVETVRTWAGAITSFFQAGVNRLGSYLETSFQWVGETVQEVGETLERSVVQPIDRFFESLPRVLGDAVGGVVDWFRGLTRNAEINLRHRDPNDPASGPSGVWDFVRDNIIGTVSEYWERFIDWLARHAPMTPDKAPGMASGLLSIGATSVAALGMMTIGGELLHPLKNMGLGNIAAMVGDMISYREVSRLIMAGALGAAIALPLGYYIRSLLRPLVPGVRELDGMVARYGLVPPAQRRDLARTADGLVQLQQLNIAEYKRLGAFSGYTDETLDKMIDVAYTSPSFRLLQALARDGAFDEASFRRYLLDARYEPEVIEAMLDMLARTAQGDVKASYASTAIGRYRDGLVDRAGLDRELAMLGYAEDKLSALGVAAELIRQTDTTSEMVGAWRAALQADRISEDLFRFGVTDLGVTPERVELYVRQNRVRKGSVAGPVDETSLVGHYAATAVRGLRDGWMSLEEYSDTLVSLGYGDLDITQLLLRALLEQRLDYADELARAYSTAYQRSQLTADEYDAALAELGMLPDRRAIIIRRDTILKAPKVAAPRLAAPIELTLSQIETAYRRGDVGEPELRARLADRGYQPGDIDLLVLQFSPAT